MSTIGIRRNPRHRLALRVVLTAVLVAVMVLAYTLIGPFEGGGVWPLVTVIVAGAIVSFILAGWLTALVFYDAED